MPRGKQGFAGRRVLRVRALADDVVRQPTHEPRWVWGYRVARYALTDAHEGRGGRFQVGKAEGKKKVMVLGGTGFVGQEICKQALEAGFDVVAVSRRGVPEVSAKPNPTQTT
jgi:phosphoglycerate dehydrogenase-like enzyme